MNVALTFDHGVTSFSGEGVEHADNGLVNKKVAKGAGWWTRGTTNEIAGLMFSCPCGCGNIGFLPVKPGYANSHWKWNGDEVKPTLTPSVQKTCGCSWHGYLTNGVWTPC